MTPSFDLVYEDFAREVTTIRELLRTCYGSTTNPPASVPVRTASSNASVLLLAASYEEFTRQCAREYANALIAGDPPLSRVPIEFPQAIWERLIFTLRAFKPGDARSDVSTARAALNQLLRFCLDNDRSAAVAETIAYNQRNLTARETNIIFKRLGIQDCCRAVGGRAEIINFFGSPDCDRAHGRMIAFISDFYDIRNEVAHSIGSRRTSGSIDINRYLDFFESFAAALMGELNDRTTVPT